MSVGMLSVLHALRVHARTQAATAAIVTDEGPVSYAELWDRTLRSATWLRARGAQPGDRIATALPPSADHLALLLGAMYCGCIAAPLNTRLTSVELDRYVAPLAPAVVVDEPPRLDDVAPADGTPAAGDAPALVLGTGGTTGVPKAAMYSHETLWRWTISAASHQHVRRHEIELSATPFFHGFLVSGLLTTLLCGGTIRLLPRFDADRAVAAIEHDGVTRFSAPPTMLVAMAGILAAAGRTAPVRTILFSSSEPPPGLAERAAAAFPGVELMTGYGTTEFGPAARLYLADDPTFAAGCIGRPIPTVDLAVLREDGTPAETGERGEIVVTSPWQMSGYWANPEETANVTTAAGGIRSGDLAMFGEDGTIRLLGRSKDVISTGGENVFPVEVEAVLGRHPAVAQVAVYGVTDAYWGERVEVAVVPREGAEVELEELCRFARAELAGYKLPKVLRTMDALPMTANMKVSRRTLREAVREP